MSTGLIIGCILFTWASSLGLICFILKAIGDDIAAVKADTEQIRQDMLQATLTRGSFPSGAPPPITPPAVR